MQNARALTKMHLTSNIFPVERQQFRKRILAEDKNNACFIHQILCADFTHNHEKLKLLDLQALPFENSVRER